MCLYAIYSWGWIRLFLPTSDPAVAGHNRGDLQSSFIRPSVFLDVVCKW